MIFECRTCLKLSDNVHKVYSNDLPHKIETISSVEILLDYRFPSKICEDCVRNVNQMYEFRKVVQMNNVILMRRCIKEEVVTGTENKQNEENFDNEAVETNFVFKEEDICNDLEIEKVVNDEIEVPVIDNKKNKIFKCSRCDFTSPDHDLLKDHRKKHIKDRKTICSICGKMVTSYNLTKHNLSHTGSPVKCSICEKVCKHKEALRLHMFMHRNEPSLCTICGKVFRHKQHYNLHIKQHAAGGGKKVECLTCGKLFYNNQRLKSHMYSHTGERPFPCKFCEKGFSSRYAVKTHERLHTKEKPFSCDFCDAAFPQRVSLRTHLKSKHGDKIIVNKEITE